MGQQYRITFFWRNGTNYDKYTVTPSGSTCPASAKFTATISELSFVKRIFAPCGIEAVLKFTEPTGYAAILDKFKTFEKVKLEVVSTDTTPSVLFTIAENYIIRDIDIEIVGTGTNTTTIVHLSISSPDALLTDRKYCRTYVKDKLGSILQSAVTEFGGGVLSVDCSKMKFLNYTNTSDKTDEFRQPYLVQYNESVYDLVARTANRCGEFLYFEGGKLHLGLDYTIKDGKPNPTEISKYDSFRVNQKKGRSDATVKKSGKLFYDNRFGSGSSVPDYPFNNEVAYDEHLNSYEKDKYDDWESEDKVNCHIASDIFSTVLQCTEFIDTFVDLGVMIGVRYGADHKWAKDGNNAFNKKFFPDSSRKNESDYKNKTHVSDKYDADQYDNADNSKYKTLSPFKTYSSVVKTADGAISTNKQIDNDFYDYVFSVEEAVSQSNLELVLNGENISDIGLGAIINVGTVSDRKYVVTEVCGGETVSGDNWSDTMTVKAVEIFNDKPLPPPCVSDFARRGGAQTAVVKDLMDPERAGRVRVAFPWDKSGNYSPWARVAMASANHDGGGEAYFKPSVDDEVLVEYIGRNMERPYVAGFLHGKTGLEYGGRTYTNVITTPGGQTIRQKDTGDGIAVMGSVSPIVGTLRQLIPGFSFEASDIGKKMMGFTEITDTYGMYDIILSSEKRAVTINSPFGKVGISAYTGISIEAPNGDISISGKNVSIEAGNNLTLTSGANLQRVLIANHDNVTGANVKMAIAKKLFQDELIGKLIDLKLLRCVIETVIKPIEGTLEIKSNRFLILEAGEGDAEIPRNAFKAENTDKAAKDGAKVGYLVAVVNQLKSIAPEIKRVYRDCYNNVALAYAAYTQTLNGINMQIPDDLKVDSLINEGKNNSVQRNIKIDDVKALFGDNSDNIGNVILADIASQATTLSNAVRAFYHIDITTLNGYNGLNELPLDLKQKAKRAMVKAANTALSDGDTFPAFKEDNTYPNRNFSTLDVTELYRYLFVKFMERAGDDFGVNINAPASYSNDAWDKFISDPGSIVIGVKGPAIPVIDLGEEIKKYFKSPFKRLGDLGVWDKVHSKGALLFSDRKAVTARFKNGILTESSNYGEAGVEKSGGKKSGGVADSISSLKTELGARLNDPVNINLPVNQVIPAEQNINNEPEQLLQQVINANANANNPQ